MTKESKKSIIYNFYAKLNKCYVIFFIVYKDKTIPFLFHSILHGKNDFAEVSKNLSRYRVSENNFIRLSK